MNTVETVSLDRAINRGPNIFSDAIRGLMLVVSKAIVISVSLVLIVIGLTAVSSEVRAEKPNPVNSVESGSLLIKVMPSGEYVSAPLVNTEVELNVSGIVSRAKVIQHFKNDSQDWVEGKYVFPLPENSAVDKLRMRIGERVIEGQIKEREQAKKEFEKAAKEGKQASLIEQQRPNIFTSRVTNIAPGETIIVEIEYQNTLIYRDGLVGLRFPLVVGPRYIPAMQRGETNIESAPIDPEVAKDAYEISPLVIAKGEPLRNPVSIKLRVDAGFPIDALRSTNHAIKKTKVSDNVYEVSLMDSTVPADRDFEVSWTAQDGNMPNSSIFTETKGDKNYALITLFPPKTVHQTLSRMPRDVVFVVDTSGSMSGTSLEQAKNALNLAVRRLHKSDRFNIIQFNSYTSSLFDKELPADSSNLKVACNYIKNLKADNGTEIAPALDLALSRDANPGRLRQVVFMTDAWIGNESQLFSIINQRLKNNRLFTVGIGSAPNDYFMTKAAELGRGTFTYIASINDVESKMNDFFSRLENPYVTDIQINWPNGMTTDAAPNVIPDLYLGDPVVVAVQTPDRLIGDITISGVVDGKQWVKPLSLSSSNPGIGVSQLWARRKISELMDMLYYGVDEEKIRDSVLKIALEHSLVTKYSSLIAVDVTPVRVKERLMKRRVPVNLPKGANQEKIFGELPQTATPAELHFYAALVLLLLTLITWYWPQLSNAWRRR